MAINKYIYIFRGINLSSPDNKSEIKNESFHFTAVGVNELNDAIAIAQKAVKEGMQAIELCGAFGHEGRKMIIKAINNVIPVGNVSYTNEQ